MAYNNWCIINKDKELYLQYGLFVLENGKGKEEICNMNIPTGKEKYKVMKINSMISSMRYAAISLFFLLSFSSVSGQGWVETYTIAISGPNDSLIRKNAIVDIPDYASGVTYPMSSVYVGSGHKTYYYYEIEGEAYDGTSCCANPSPEEGFWYDVVASHLEANNRLFVLENRLELSTGKKELYLSKSYSLEAGEAPKTTLWRDPVWEDTLGFNISGAALTEASDSQLVVLGMLQSEPQNDTLARELFLARIKKDGTREWSRLFSSPGDDLGVQVILAPDGGFWLLKNVRPDVLSMGSELWLMKTDEEGIMEWEQPIGNPNDFAYDMVLASDGGLAITGENGNGDLFVLKVQPDGMFEWQQNYDYPERYTSGRAIIEDPGHHLVVAGLSYIDVATDSNALLVKLAADGSPLWEREYDLENSEGFNDVVITPAGSYLMGGYAADLTVDKTSSYLQKTDTFGIVKSAVVKGNIFYDADFDCLPAPDEQKLEGWKVKVSNDTLLYQGYADEQGNYRIPVSVPESMPTDYTVSLIPPSSYWQACENDIAITANYLDTVQLDFPVQAIVECPFVQLDIVSSRLRPCETEQIYIDYCNDGPAIAEEAYIDFTMPGQATFSDASINPSAINGPVYTFPLGDLPPNECSTLVINFVVDCDSTLGQDLCFAAAVYPDTICQLPGSEWSGALLNAGNDCDEGEIVFELENVGSANMAGALNYIIIEDAVLLMENSFNLNSGESLQTAPLPLDGSNYQLLAPQEPGAPGSDWISISSVACTTVDTMATEFPQYNGDPFSYEYCVTVVGPYDPNDIQSTPAGFGAEQYILPNMDIQYRIRFQNVGTDTAYRVIIRDTIPEYLEPASIEPGASSHPYRWYYDGDARALVFEFHNINLPDSTTNLEASQAYVSFTIAQQPGLEDNTVIENQAAIYFDFNEPIFTNTKWLTIADIISLVSESTVSNIPTAKVSVVPNPMSNGAWVNLENAGNLNRDVELRLYDSMGRQVRSVPVNEGQFWIERTGLNPGLYLFSISSAGKWMASGKLAVK